MARLATFGAAAVTVSSLDRSTNFYREVFGFDELATTNPGGEGGNGRTRFLDLDGVTLELVELKTLPDPTEDKRPMARLGILSHLAFNVADLDAAERRIRAAGGVVGDGSRRKLDSPGLGVCEIMFAQDPDGVWLELLSVDEARRRSYLGLTPATQP